MKIQSPPKMNYGASYRKNDVSFGSSGGIKNALKSIPTNTFKLTEKGGFFLEFLIVDALSMIAPRVWVGLNRDRDKTGQVNIQAGAEEFGREILSGPSMNLIPMAIASIAVHKFMPAIKMDTPTLEGLNQHLKNIVDENPNHPDLADKGKLNKKLAEKLFDNTFGGSNFDLDNKNEYKNEFVDLLEKSTTTKPKLALFRKLDAARDNLNDYDKAEKAFDNLIVKINNKEVKDVASDEIHNISLPISGKKDPHKVNAKDLFEDFRNYSKDVIDKFVKPDSTKGNVEEFFRKIETKRKATKIGLAVATFFAVGGFLLYLPKIYQLSQSSPAEQSAERAKKEALAQGGANEN